MAIEYISVRCGPVRLGGFGFGISRSYNILVRPFEWSEEFGISVPEIDAEHQAMFRLADSLYEALIADASTDQLALLRELATHMAGHLSHEESLMRASGYPLGAWHQRQHAAASGKLRLLERRIRRGDHSAALLVLDLSVWLKNHIRLADRMLAAYLRNHQRAQAALAS